MTYSPVLHVGSSTWMVGRIQDHTAKPLSKDEVERVCALLNDPEITKATVERAERAHQEVILDGFANGESITCKELRLNAVRAALLTTSEGSDDENT